jgi:hypothetical protein
MPSLLSTYLLGSIILAASGAVNLCKDLVSPQLTERQLEEILYQLLAQQVREELKKNTSMMFRSPSTIEQALKRRLFDQHTIKEVADHDLVGKSFAQARQQLLGLGFQGSRYGYGWNEPHECKRLYTAFVGIALSVVNDTVKSVIVNVGFTGP